MLSCNNNGDETMQQYKGDYNMAEIIKIDAGTWRFEDGFVRFFLVEGDDKAAMIDSGVNSPDAKMLAQSVTDKPIILINTHGDGDHTSGTGAFSEIYMHSFDYYNCEIDKHFPNTSLTPIEDEDVIELGNRPLKVIHIPGHTKGSVALLDIDRRVLYAGDSVQKGHIYMFGDKREPLKYASSLDKLIKLEKDYDQIYASHDEFLVSANYVKKVKDVWEQLQSGDLSYEIIDLFGNKVKSYSTNVCGFYME